VLPFVGVPQAYLGAERHVVLAFVPDNGNSVLQITHLPVVFARHLRDQLTTAIDMDEDVVAHAENEAMARRAAESLSNVTLVR
jgi:hypothetical protein